MSPPPPCKRFQIHLSTAIVMMFVAGALIWANTTGNESWHRWMTDETWAGESQPGWSDVILVKYGWPLAGTEYFPHGNYRDHRGRLNVHFDWTDNHYSKWAINGFVGTIILFSVWRLCEWLIRRRGVLLKP